MTRSPRGRAAGVVHAHALGLAVLALGLASGGAAGAQDFALPAPTPLDAEASLLESALPRAATGVRVSAGTIDWYGAPGLLTRAVTAELGTGPWRGACGVSQTGEPDIGWTTLGLAFGAVGRDWGVGARALARRDRLSDFGLRVLPGEGGLEGGAGAWVVLGDACTLWTSAAGLVTTGADPPLARPLEAGLRWHSDGLALWLAHRSAPAGYGAASHAAGASATSGPLRVWLDAHDAPLAGGMGVSWSRAPIEAGVEVESHPFLPPLTRVSVTLSRPGP